MNVEDIVQARIGAARVRVQAAKRRREELSAARKRGLAARHAAKLRHLRGAEDHAAMGQPPPTVTETVTAEPGQEDDA
ncbi:hypothetical protein [Streptomyces sp. NRRL S-4]|uniref:hypothetical protein n=1 Tax=Streptomyces sp. NRRL S-4 TaxID=1519471 RepID=UPI0006B63B99|nr:hypothetical protein [Streptomyces sp. NRRL S-4]KPC79537.1 hypothetical protein ADK82_25755 [Streptomyces sp. NRRL S-4]